MGQLVLTLEIAQQVDDFGAHADIEGQTGSSGISSRGRRARLLEIHASFWKPRAIRIAHQSVIDCAL